MAGKKTLCYSVTTVVNYLYWMIKDFVTMTPPRLGTRVPLTCNSEEPLYTKYICFSDLLYPVCGSGIKIHIMDSTKNSVCTAFRLHSRNRLSCAWPGDLIRRGTCEMPATTVDEPYELRHKRTSITNPPDVGVMPMVLLANWKWGTTWIKTNFKVALYCWPLLQ